MPAVQMRQSVSTDAKSQEQRTAEPLLTRGLAPPKKLLDQVRETIRRKHYSIRTEEAYVDWIN